ncbi:hypothetical protein JXA02_12840 [candidate division KSB1 bacterium]|nr:hypothetical protein [candidate division KSB1 bacterium]
MYIKALLHGTRTKTDHSSGERQIRRQLRVSGIGLISAKKIVAQRRIHALRYEDLHKIGIVLRRAHYFITVNGRYHGTHAPEALQLAEAHGATAQLEFYFTGVSHP